MLTSCKQSEGIAWDCNRVDGRLTKIRIFVGNTRLDMATISATLSSRIDARGKAEILLRFVGGRDHIYRLHSGLFVSPSRWKEGAVVVPRLETDEQKELRALASRLSGLISFLLDEFGEADKEAVSRAWLQDRVGMYHHPEKTAGADIYALYSEFMLAKDVGERRMRRYRVVLEALKRFEVWRGKPVPVGGVGPEMLDELRGFLENEYIYAGRRRWRTLYGRMDRVPEKRSDNTIVDYMKVLRAFWRWMRAKGVTDADPFDSYEIGTEVYGTPYYITIDERERLYRTNLKRHPALAVQRDIFVFQCLVGCRVGDLVGLKKGDIVDGVLVYVPRKTMRDGARDVRVPLTRTALEIVERYRDFKGDALLPFISPQKYNDAIKRCFLAARLTRPVSVLDPVSRREVKRPLNEIASSHLARRTFIGNLYRKVKDQNIVGAMSGHGEASRAFARYRTIDDEIRAETVALLEK